MIRRVLLLALLIPAGPHLAVAFDQPYRGGLLQALASALQGNVWPTTVTCRAAIALRGGYYRTPDGWSLEHAAAERQKQESTWIVTMTPERARVTDGQGNVGIYHVTKLDAGRGVILVEADRDLSIQIITIDPTTSSFVYTTQNTQPLWNRASVFTGRCE